MTSELLAIWGQWKTLKGSRTCLETILSSSQVRCALGKTINELFGLNLLSLKQSQYQQIRRWGSGVCLQSGSSGKNIHCWTQGWEATKPGAVLPLPHPHAYVLGEAGPDTDALTVLSSENPLPSPLPQYHIDPRIDEDSHSEGQVEGHHWRVDDKIRVGDGADTGVSCDRKGESKAVCQIWDLNGEHKLWPQTTCGICTLWSTRSLEEQGFPVPPTPSRCPSSHAASSRRLTWVSYSEATLSSFVPHNSLLLSVLCS